MNYVVYFHNLILCVCVDQYVMFGSLETILDQNLYCLFRKKRGGGNRNIDFGFMIKTEIFLNL